MQEQHSDDESATQWVMCLEWGISEVKKDQIYYCFSLRTTREKNTLTRCVSVVTALSWAVLGLELATSHLKRWFLIIPPTLLARIRGRSNTKDAQVLRYLGNTWGDLQVCLWIHMCVCVTWCVYVVEPMHSHQVNRTRPRFVNFYIFAAVCSLVKPDSCLLISWKRPMWYDVNTPHFLQKKIRICGCSRWIKNQGKWDFNLILMMSRYFINNDGLV